jgi:hypothetical protein
MYAAYAIPLISAHGLIFNPKKGSLFPNWSPYGTKGNLLITGGLGYLGAHTVVEILRQSDKCGFYKIVIVDNLSNSNINVLKRIL